MQQLPCQAAYNALQEVLVGYHLLPLRREAGRCVRIQSSIKIAFSYAQGPLLIFIFCVWPEIYVILPPPSAANAQATAPLFHAILTCTGAAPCPLNLCCSLACFPACCTWWRFAAAICVPSGLRSSLLADSTGGGLLRSMLSVTVLPSCSTTCI